MELSLLNLIVSAAGLAFTYALFGWGFWLGYKGITANHPAHVDFGHAPGAPGTYDPIYENQMRETRQPLKAA
jgi:hypothetical protein